METKPKDLYVELTMRGLVQDPAWSQSGKEAFPVVHMKDVVNGPVEDSETGGGDMASLES